MIRTAHDAAAYLTPIHPCGLFIAGPNTSVGISWNLHDLCDDNPDIMLLDAATSQAPLIVYCKRDTDRDAIAEILNESAIGFTCLG